MIAPVTHILPLARIRRSRMLPGKGTVLVSMGEKVSATDVIAVAYVPGGHILLDIRRALSLSSYDETQKLIDRKVGDRVEKGDIIAQTNGFLPRVVRAPVGGAIISIQKGQVLLEQFEGKCELYAGIGGTVVEVLPEHGVVIETNGALIQGVWGNHRIDQGLLLRQAQSADSELNRTGLDISMRGAILVAGFASSMDALEAVSELPVKGLILASMASHLIPFAMKASFPIILTEGFGRIPMNSKAFNLLATNERRDVSLNSSWNTFLGERPELSIQLPAEGQPVLDATEFLPGKTVRVHSAPYAGQIGTLSFIRSGQTLIANGLRAPAAEIRLENGQQVTLPLANLDVLE